MLKLVALDDLLLFEDFERIHLVGVLLDHQENLAVGAFSDHRLRDEVLRLHFARLLLLGLDDRLVVCNLFLAGLAEGLLLLKSKS